MRIILTLILFLSTPAFADNPFRASLEEIDLDDRAFSCEKKFVSFRTLAPAGILLLRKTKIVGILAEAPPEETITVLLTLRAPKAVRVSVQTYGLLRRCLN